MSSKESPSLDQFQDQVSQLLLRHRSVLDIMSKLDQTSAAVNRSVTKAITDCGCIELNASKQPFNELQSLDASQSTINNHLSGQLCEHCKEFVESSLGRNLFYLTALCTQLQLDLTEVVAAESTKCSTLGVFNLT
ncbi:DUF1573 domain-containing protein [Paenibacillus endoradicis]|uniref:DUF1573 domain-containing protein n=1 Tax=Paenibacillus endoradicis TaxID=2972487 RepID=UPI002158DD38|nr:DUF1573 domain-containing protein [Paenibacillus endoradicis]MCR8660746.1 DUF1573 domain-containing protein [Paenibacillus endoradicis]